MAETTSEGDWLLAAIGQDDDEIDGEDMGLHVSEVGPHDEGEEHTYEEGNWEGDDNENGGYDESGELRFSSCATGGRPIRRRHHYAFQALLGSDPVSTPLTCFVFFFPQRPL